MTAPIMAFNDTIDPVNSQYRVSSTNTKPQRRSSRQKQPKRQRRRRSSGAGVNRKKLVKFNRPIVTEVKEIPSMDPDERVQYFYSEDDIAKFRAKTEKRKARHKSIRFTPEVVSDIVYFPPIPTDEYDKFFYSVDELEKMLEEFLMEEPEGVDNDVK